MASAIHAVACVRSAGVAAASAAVTRARAGCRRTAPDFWTGKSARDHTREARKESKKPTPPANEPTGEIVSFKRANGHDDGDEGPSAA
jgi:hypothetical protein